MKRVGLLVVAACGMFVSGGFAQEAEPLMTFGAMADCQYTDHPDAGQRLYRRSVGKLRDTVAHYNTMSLRYVVHLGDFIDRDWESFDTLMPITDTLKHRLYHVLGNHDFSVADDKKPLVHTKLGLPSRYYDFTVAKWRFIVVDGNDMSLHGWPKDSERYAASKKMHEEHYKESPNWNGAVGSVQLAWIEKTIQAAAQAGESVVLYCHFPIYPSNVHNLWNADEIVTLLEKYPAVKAWINGHNHAGNYGEKNGIHYLTLKGMVDTEDTSYSVVRVFANHLEVKGFGRQEDFSLTLR